MTDLPRAADLLFWSPSQQDLGYPRLDRIFPSRTVACGPSPSPLPDGTPIEIGFDYDHRPYRLEDVFKVNRTSAILVLHDGQVVLEHYAPGRSRDERWPSFSIAKSVTSTLVGIALGEGAIRSLDDPVTGYIPESSGSAFDGMTVRHLLLMASGIEWSEDYGDPGSDRARIGFLAGPDLFAALAGKPRVADPGATFHYKTSDTGLLGAIVARATGRTLSDYLGQKIWLPCGMEAEASWILHGEEEVAGTCLSARLRDFGRFGQLILANGKVGETQVLPPGWVGEATAGVLPTPYDGVRYGYQWWVHPDGGVEAVGIMGQSILIDRATRTVIVIQSAWNNSGTEEQHRLQRALQMAVLAAVRSG